MLTKEENLEFLGSKIREIKFAKFHAEIDSLLQLPANVVTAFKVDEESNVWFFTSCNGTYADNMEKSFYASLDFYNRASDSRLHIDGKATIVTDREDMLPLRIANSRHYNAYDIVLVKLKILKAEYREAKHITTSFRETVRNIFVQLFYSDMHKEFNFFEAVSNELA